MVNKELILKFSNEKYYTKQEVQRELRIPSVDGIWDEVQKYRANFFKPLSLKHLSGGRLNICLTPSINNKINDFERKLLKLTIEYSKLKVEKTNHYFEFSQQKIIVDELASYYHIDTDENIINSLVKNELSLIPPQYYFVSNYLKCLNNIKSNVNEDVNDICLGNFYQYLMGSDNLVEFYRTKEIINEYNRVLIDKIYIGIPSKAIEESMDNLFNFVVNSDTSLFVKAASSFYYMYYIHPFEYYSEEISVLFFKKILSYYDVGEVASLINFEKILNDKEKLESVLAISQKNLDLTYFLEYLLNNYTKVIQETLNNLIISKNKELTSEFFQKDEEKIEEDKKEVEIHDVFENLEEKKEETVVSPSSNLNYNADIAIKNVPSGLSEEDAKKLEQHLREMNPSLSKSQAYFYARHCTLGMSYTIFQFKNAVGCAYETARTSMDNLVNLGYYRKEMLKNKFVYTPVKKY